MAGLDSLKGAVVVITGGASGIGRATAELAASRGAAVAVVDTHEQRLAETVAALEARGARAVGLSCDVTDDAAVAALPERVRAGVGDPDMVFLNAGISASGPPDLVPLDLYRSVMEVNFYGVLRGVQAFAPALRAKGQGNVVITASVAGRYAYSFDAAPYIASKFAVYGLAETLALYLVPQGVAVSVLCPGLVATNMGETARRGGVPEGASWGWFPFSLQSAITPEAAADTLIAGVLNGSFLIYTHPEEAELMARRGADVDADLDRQRQAMPDPRPPAGG